MSTRLLVGVCVMDPYARLMATYAKNDQPLPSTYIPEPIFDSEPGYIDLYWAAWKSAWDHVITNPDFPHSPYLDEAFQADLIWIWDSCFMTLFARYAHEVFPSGNTLDNFYSLMLDGASAPVKIHHPDNPPLFAWAELELFNITGDTGRVRRLLVEDRVLQRMFNKFEGYQVGQKPSWANCEVALQREPDGYRWSGCPNGMDNTPRGDFDYESIYWLDAMAQQALSASCIAELANRIGEHDISRLYSEKHSEISQQLNELYWDSEDGFYYDRYIQSELGLSKIKTPASYWPVLAGVSSPDQTRQLIEAAEDPKIFGGKVPFPAVARSSKYFEPKGRYMQSAIWLPLVYMSTKSVQKGGELEIARDLSVKMLDHMLETYRTYEPATIWECYSPDMARPSSNSQNEGRSRPDFCGWSALGPIALFIENVLGFHTIDAASNLVCWRTSIGRHGIRNLSFGSVKTDIVFDNGVVQVDSNLPYTLEINGTRHSIVSGEQIIAI